MRPEDRDRHRTPPQGYPRPPLYQVPPTSARRTRTWLHTVARVFGVGASLAVILTALAAAVSHFATTKQVDKIERTVSYDHDVLMQIAGQLGIKPGEPLLDGDPTSKP